MTPQISGYSIWPEQSGFAWQVVVDRSVYTEGWHRRPCGRALRR
jgi:hypothetical protein